MRRWVLLLLPLLLCVLAVECSSKGDDDDAGGASDCIVCSTTSECTTALGAGWGCVAGCCVDINADDDTAADDDAVTDDDADPYGLTWIGLDEGTFQMGCSLGDTDCLANENPRHAVVVSAFSISAA